MNFKPGDFVETTEYGYYKGYHCGVVMDQEKLPTYSYMKDHIVVDILYSSMGNKYICPQFMKEGSLQKIEISQFILELNLV